MDNIENIIDDVIEKLSIRKPDRHDKIERIWLNILTEYELKHTRIDKLEKENLYVTVSSATLMYQLRGKKYIFLKRIQEEISDIKNIILKIGKVL